MPRLLDFARSGVYEAGTNLRGAASGGGWLYALPRLSYDRVVCLGRPSAGTLAALARIGHVRVVEGSDPGARSATLESTDGPVDVTLAEDLGDEPIDLLVAGSGTSVPSALLTTALSRLASDGIAYLQPAPRAALPPGVGPTLALDLSPIRGETRAIVPVGDGQMSDLIDRMGLSGTVSRGRRAVRIERWLTAGRSVRGLIRRHALVTGPGLVAPTAVPRYIRELATESGLDLEGWSWAVAARGEYDSQKVLVLLASPEADGPSGVVKITRSPEHAARLENETAALQRLATLPVAKGRAPEPWFAGTHADRWILGESRIKAEPFAQRATWRADDPLLGDALDWLTDLAAASARPAPAVEVGTALLDLLDRYLRVHSPRPEEATGLRRRFEALSALEVPIPTVVQHGDPGIWNMLADERGRAIFLDWEASEASGMPLWDILYFFRSYAIEADRRSGSRDRLESAAQHLLGGSPLADRLVQAVTAYRTRIGLPAQAIDALIYGCWLHRSLKEATRKPPEHVASGQCVRLLRRMLAAPDAPVLAALSSPSTADKDAG